MNTSILYWHYERVHKDTDSRIVDKKDDFLVYLVTDRMAAESIWKCAMSFDGTDVSAYDMPSEFLDSHIRILAAI